MKHILSTFLILSVTASKGQVQLISATELCTMMSGFSSDEEAHSVLNELLEVVHWEKNFVMAPCSGVDNACAVNVNGVRYILYNPSFMESMDNNAGDVAGYFILVTVLIIWIFGFVNRRLNRHLPDSQLPKRSKFQFIR